MRARPAATAEGKPLSSPPPSRSPARRPLSFSVHRPLSIVPRPLDDPPPRRPPYFWWLLANALALCFAVISWAICLHVFGNPEIPRNYQILEKIGRVPELKRHTVLDAPNVAALDPRELYRKFFALDGDSRDRLNTVLLRNYLTNFERPLMLTYIQGDYLIEHARALDESDFLIPGFAVRARAMVKPDDFTEAAPYPVVIEYLFPTPQVAMADQFREGDTLEVRKSPNCAAILHIARTIEDDEPALLLTVVPIAYGPYRIDEETSFDIEVPARLNPGARFPVFSK